MPGRVSAYAHHSSLAIGHVGRVTYYASPRPAVTWPYQVGVLPRQADCFQDRAAAQQLEHATAGGGTAVLCQVLAGMGGVGKTQLAAHHARTQWQTGQLDLLVWITATTAPQSSPGTPRPPPRSSAAAPWTPIRLPRRSWPGWDPNPASPSAAGWSCSTISRIRSTRAACGRQPAHMAAPWSPPAAATPP